jgi:folate-binding protein YgfZ
MTDATTVELDAEYRQLREECGLVDRSGRGKISLSGPDAVEYLQGQLTNDVEALDPDRGCYAALLDRKGHLQADMRVLRLSTGQPIWIDLEPEPTAAVLRHLRTYSIGREVEIEDVTERWAILSLIGPRAAGLSGFEGIGPEHAQRFREWGGVEVLAVATTAGVRIESGTPRFGAEMSAETMPAEAGIVDRAVSFTKGCYIGQEPVARLHYRGKPNRTLRGLELSGPVERGDELRLGEKAVGRIGSACVSPARGPIALAIVRREAEPGAELAVGEAGVTARVVELPFG